MKITIDAKKLIDAPYSSAKKHIFSFEDSVQVNQLVAELENSNPSSFLISGYRGVGKTSLVNRVKEQLEDSFICVHVSLAKYDSYSVLLRKLIRQLYIGFTDSSMIRANVSIPGDLKERFELIYDRTFKEVTNHSTQRSERTNSRRSEIAIDAKKLLPLLLLLFSSVNVLSSLIASLPVNYMLLLLSIIWTALTWDIRAVFSQTTSTNSETSRKSFYDDDIAEYHLFEILRDLRQLNLKALIVFDELDKIQELDRVETIMNELKGLLLSGLSHTIVVSGQTLYYQWEKARFQDDPMIVSLFSKTIHVAFLPYSSIKKFCLSAVTDDDVKKNNLFNDYFDGLILQSGRVPRRLSNLIRKNLSWDQSEAFIEIPENKAKEFKYTSRLLAIVNKIIDSDLPSITSDQVMMDFFIAQLHRWIQKINDDEFSGFTSSVIIAKDKYNTASYPERYINQITPLAELLFDRLVQENILRLSMDAEEQVEYYQKVVSETETTVAGSDHVPANFLIEYIELEAYVRAIYNDLIGENKDARPLPLFQIFNKLSENKIISLSEYSSKQLKSLTDLRNKSVHGTSMEGLELSTIQAATFDIGRIKSELLEKYCYHLCKNYFSDLPTTKENNAGVDFQVLMANFTVLFDVKLLQHAHDDRRIILDIINKFNNIQQIQSERSIYSIFLFQKNGLLAFDQFDAKFRQELQATNPEYAARVFLFNASEKVGDVTKHRMNEYFKQIERAIWDDFL